MILAELERIEQLDKTREGLRLQRIFRPKEVEDNGAIDPLSISRGNAIPP